MATFKDFVSKQLFGYSQREIAQGLGNLVNQNMFQWIGKDMEISVSDNYDYLINGFMSVPAVYEAITLITNKIAACPVLIYKVVNETKLKQYDNYVKSGTPESLARASMIKADALEEVDEKAIRKLIDRPNEEQSWDDFIRLLSVLLLSTGNSLMYGNASDKRSKKLTEAWALPFNPNQYTMISGGIFDPVKSYSITYNAGNSELNFPAEQITHFKTVNPLWQTSAGQLYGMSPLHPYIAKLLRSQLGDKAANRLLSNGFKMGLVTPRDKQDGWSADQAKGVMELLGRAANSDGKSRFVATSHSLDFQEIGLDYTELGILDLDKADREAIYRGYQIPLAYASTDQSSYNNEEQAGRRLIYNAVAPYCELIADNLTEAFCVPHNDAKNKFIIRLDYMSLSELSADMVKMSDWLDKSPEITWNERRELKGFGKLDLAGMDEPMINRNYVPLSRVVNGENLSGSGNGNTGNNEGAN